MASLIWELLKLQCPLKKAKTAHLTQGDPRSYDPHRAVIAKGNIIEGIEAEQ